MTQINKNNKEDNGTNNNQTEEKISLPKQVIGMGRVYRQTNQDACNLLKSIAKDWQFGEVDTDQEERETAFSYLKEIVAEQTNSFTRVSVDAIDACLELAEQSKNRDPKMFDAMLKEAISLTKRTFLIGSNLAGHFNTVYRRVIAALASVDDPDYAKIDSLYEDWVRELCMHGGTYRESYWREALAKVTGERALLLVCKFANKTFEVESMLSLNSRVAFTNDEIRKQAHAKLAKAILLYNEIQKSSGKADDPTFADVAKALEEGITSLGYESDPPAWGDNPTEQCAALYRNCLLQIKTAEELETLKASFMDLAFHSTGRNREAALAMLTSKLTLAENLLGKEAEPLVNLLENIARVYLHLNRPEESYATICRAKEIWQLSADGKERTDCVTQELALMHQSCQALEKMNRQEEADRLHQEFEEKFSVKLDGKASK
jgi:hypothetical protein